MLRPPNLKFLSRWILINAAAAAATTTTTTTTTITITTTNNNNPTDLELQAIKNSSSTYIHV
jgi:hypothetical protein